MSNKRYGATVRINELGVGKGWELLAMVSGKICMIETSRVGTRFGVHKIGRNYLEVEWVESGTRYSAGFLEE